MQKTHKTDTIIQRGAHTNAFTIAVIFGVMFIGFFIFFTVAHPLYVYDGDDWMYITPWRRAIPIWKAWNPTKVLTETLMPLTAELGLWLFMPFSGDYIGSMAIAFALVVSAFYSAYFILFYYVARKKFQISVPRGLTLAAFMLLLHFLHFLSGGTPPENAYAYAYMYAGRTVTTVFGYTIPALLNASLVLLFSSGDHVGKADVRQMLREPKLRYGILLLMLYLAVNSNIFHSILLIAYIASVLMVEYIKRGVKSLPDVCRKNILWLGVIFVWLLSLLMESQGGRAEVRPSGSYLSAVVETLRVMKSTIKWTDNIFKLISAAIVGFALVLFLSSRKSRTDCDREYARLTVIYSLSLLITAAYLVLLCAVTGAHYISRSDVLSGIFFYVMMLVWTSLIYIIQKFKPVMILMPLAIYVLLFDTVFTPYSYRELNESNYSAAVVKQISNDLLEQVLLADAQGQRAMELYVPVYTSDYGNNWPIFTYIGESMSSTLFEHGMIREKMEITVVPTYAMNEKYHLPLP